MSALMESLTSLSKLKLPGPQLTSLVEVLWNSKFDEQLATEILTEVDALLQASASGTSLATRKHNDITVDSIPYWIMVSGIAAVVSETHRQRFLDEFAIRLLSHPLSTSKALPLRILEVIYRTTIQQAIKVATESHRQLWTTIFVDISLDPSEATSSNRKGSKSLRTVDIARWAVEAIEEQGKSVESLLGEPLLSKYIAMCLEYARKTKEVAIYRTTVILSILPRILPKTYGSQIWQLVLLLLNAKEDANLPVDYAPFKLQESDENTRLAFEIVVRFYEWLFTADFVSNSDSALGTTASSSETSGFELRRDAHFFQNWLFPGISSPDSVVRKRAIYLLKRISNSSANVKSKWWNPEALKSNDGPSAMERFLLLLDTLDDHDFNILLSMWPMFEPLAASCAPDLTTTADALLHDGMMKLFFRRCIWSCDSKLLQKWVLWFIIRHPHVPLIARLTSDLTFCMDLLKETVEIFGWSESNLSTRDASFIKTVKSEQQKEKDPITHGSFHPFLASVIFNRASNPENLSEEEYAVNYSRALIHATLSSAAIPASTVVSVLSFFASRTAVKGHTWPLPVFNPETTIRLLNCLQSTFMGYTNEFAYLCMQGGLGALALHVERSNPAVCPLLLQVISSVSPYFRAKPAIHACLSSIAEFLATTPAEKEDAEKGAHSSWLLSHLTSEIASIFDVSTHFSAVARSTNLIRSFNHAETILDKTTSLLGLISPSVATTFLNRFCTLVLSHIADQRTASLTTLASLANYAESQPLIWTEFVRACTPVLLSSVDLIAKSLEVPQYADEEASESLNKSIEHFGGVFATSSLRHLLVAAGYDFKPIDQSLKEMQLRWVGAGAQNAFEALNSLASFSGLLSNTSTTHPVETVVKLIKNITEYNIPHRTPAGIDGPTWKHFSAIFETARWSALNSLCASSDASLIADHQASELRGLIETCLERGENAHKRDMHLSMNVLKWLLQALPSANTDVTCDDLNEWLERLERAGRQEKTFSSKVVFFVMGAALQPALLASRKYASPVLAFIDRVLDWAETGIGPANWLVRLIENAIVFTKAHENSARDIMSIEAFALAMVPTFTKLLSFNPDRASNVQTPANTDIQLAGLDLPPVSPILHLLGKRTLSHSEEHAIHASYLKDSQVRVATATLIALLLNQFSSFNTELLRSLFDLNAVNAGEAENGAVTLQSASSVSSASAASASKFSLERKGSVAHMRQYHLLQLAPFLATNAEIPFFLSELWPVLSADHLSSVRELVTLTASVFMWRASEASEMLEVMNKITTSMRSLLTLALKSANEDGLFAWISLAGYALKQVDLKKHPELHAPWREILLSVMPFLSFNTLYIRSTAQDVIVSLLDSKEEQIRTALSPEFLEWLLGTRVFIRGLYEMRPLNRTNRREAFSADFLQYFGATDGATEATGEDPTRRVLKTLELIYAVHPVQHELPPTDHINPTLIHYEFGRLLLRTRSQSELKEISLSQREKDDSEVDSEGDGQKELGESRIEPLAEERLNEGQEEQIKVSTNSSPLPPITFQRKIVPWQNMDLGEAVNKNGKGDSGEASEGKQQKSSPASATRQEIIIVATLLKKMPNLGGLTRTAEIFAASKLVLPSLSVLQDKTFQDLAVSADHWLPMEEVPEAQLTDYLLAQKHNGYTLVGLEQTSTSHALQSYTFPDKTILLLGNEKRGIPVDLLQLLDASVEIPQLGLIRSLNVHVSASICIWEYTKQHL